MRGVCPRWWMPSHLSIIYHQLKDIDYDEFRKQPFA
nr:MAG TPA: hypothetical protein [Caudoviricetes sp.]